MNGLYITIEGPESSGKSTQAKMLVEYLSEHYPGRSVYLTKEPGAPIDPVCVQIRNLILAREHSIEEKTAFLLFLADRAQHVARVIRPALERGDIVVSDRSSLSCLVYHFAAMSDENITPAYQAQIFSFLDFAQEIQPDISFIASSDFKWAKAKIGERATPDRIESFDDHFHRKVHALFNLLECQKNEYHECLGKSAFASIKDLSCLPKQLIKLPPANHHSPRHIQSLMVVPINAALDDSFDDDGEQCELTL